VVAASLLALTVITTGCSSPATTPPASGASFDPNQGLDNPKDYVGPSTARLEVSDVAPVTDQPEQVLPVTVTDSQGTEVTVTDTSRILTLDIYGTLSQVVYGLGLGGSVVGRDASSAFPSIKDKPLVVTNGRELDAEAILNVAPSVIITDTSLGPWAVVEQMRAAGITVVVVSSERSIENLSPLTKQVAAALGVDAAGEALIQRTDQSIDQAKAVIDQAVPADSAQRMRMAFLYVRGGAGIYYIFGQDSGTDSLIEAIGGIDVATEVGWAGLQPVTDEGLVAMKPDLILMMTKGLESVGGVDGLLEQLPAVAATPAGQNRRIVDMDDSQLLAFGPNTAEVLLALAHAVYSPEAAQ